MTKTFICAANLMCLHIYELPLLICVRDFCEDPALQITERDDESTDRGTPAFSEFPGCTTVGAWHNGSSVVNK